MKNKTKKNAISLVLFCYIAIMNEGMTIRNEGMTIKNEGRL